MWTEAHRARHEAGLKSRVTMLAVGRVAAWPSLHVALLGVALTAERCRD